VRLGGPVSENPKHTMSFFLKFSNATTARLTITPPKGENVFYWVTIAFEKDELPGYEGVCKITKRSRGDDKLLDMMRRALNMYEPYFNADGWQFESINERPMDEVQDLVVSKAVDVLYQE
jgi:hypothetical protein